MMSMDWVGDGAVLGVFVIATGLLLNIAHQYLRSFIQRNGVLE